MLLFDNARLTDLRAERAKARLEKIAIAREIEGTSIPFKSSWLSVATP
jgi:hypothetical protein